MASPKAVLVAISNLQDGVDIYDIHQGCRHLLKLQTPIHPETNVRFQVAFGENGKILAVGTDAGLIKIWDTRNGILLQTLVHSSFVQSAAAG